MGSTDKWLGGLGLVLLASGLIVAPCSALASCCAAVPSAGDAASAHYALQTTTHESGSCGVPETGDPPSQGSCLRSDCEMVQGVIPVLAERWLGSSQGGELPETARVSAKPASPTHRLGSPRAERSESRVLYELHCVLLI